MSKKWWDQFRGTKRSHREAVPLAPDQEIINEIAKVLWSVFDEEAEYIIFRGQLYSEFHESQITLERKDGSVFWNELPSSEFIEGFFELLRELQQTKPFEKEKFTHMHFRLSNTKKFSADFAYIEEGNNWSGLYMRGINDLSQDEIKKYYVPQEDWEDSLEKFGPPSK